MEVLKKPSQKNRTDNEQERVQKTIIAIMTAKINSCLFYPDSERDEYLQKISLLHKRLHAAYAYRALHSIGRNVFYYDAAHPWLLYWNLLTVSVVNDPEYNLNAKDKQDLIYILRKCQAEEGGFAGAPHMKPHLAPTYAAILSIISLEDVEAYNVVNREAMYKYLMKMKHPTIRGGFIMHEKGELDLRACFIAVLAAKVFKIDTPELFNGVAEYIASCQTYEGGVSGIRGSEAHGGYAFCGIAALSLLGRMDLLDIPRLLNWLTYRQMSAEGGFNGRTNKVVDACYSFWQSGIFKILNIEVGGTLYTEEGYQLFDQLKLQMYLLLCCQEDEGGLKDKPGKMADYYHTGYSLSGFSISQETRDFKVNGQQLNYLNNQMNQLEEIDPVFNLPVKKVNAIKEYFQKLQ
eukprot:TRINITY_DN3760_c0_g1_i8.p1 TRINITY_DN3760_c0_g1~~TRINITY_DN3760_c0_g1_i8.p1  ORF type:complete len:405 (-),score=87.70 TRINITY_DN3760_c0_g1_i8:110-1324(-)